MTTIKPIQAITHAERSRLPDEKPDPREHTMSSEVDLESKEVLPPGSTPAARLLRRATMAMRHAGVTGEQLERRIGVDMTAAGVLGWKLTQIEEVAAALDVSPWWLSGVDAEAPEWLEEHR